MDWEEQITHLPSHNSSYANRIQHAHSLSDIAFPLVQELAPLLLRDTDTALIATEQLLTRILLQDVDDSDHEKEHKSILQVIAATVTSTSAITKLFISSLQSYSNPVLFIEVMARLCTDSSSDLKAVLKMYQQLMSTDRSLLLPILGSLSDLCQDKETKKRVSAIAIDALAFAEENDLPTIIHTIFSSMTNTTGQQAINSIRAEGDKLTRDSLGVIVQVIIRGLRARVNRVGLWLGCLRKNEERFNLLDTLVLLVLLDFTQYRSAVLRCVYKGIEAKKLDLTQFLEALEHTEILESRLSSLYFLLEKFGDSQETKLLKISHFVYVELFYRYSKFRNQTMSSLLSLCCSVSLGSAYEKSSPSARLSSSVIVELAKKGGEILAPQAPSLQQILNHNLCPDICHRFAHVLSLLSTQKTGLKETLMMSIQKQLFNGQNRIQRTGIILSCHLLENLSNSEIESLINSILRLINCSCMTSRLYIFDLLQYNILHISPIQITEILKMHLIPSLLQTNLFPSLSHLLNSSPAPSCHSHFSYSNSKLYFDYNSLAPYLPPLDNTEKALQYIPLHSTLLNAFVLYYVRSKAIERNPNLQTTFEISDFEVFLKIGWKMPDCFSLLLSQLDPNHTDPLQIQHITCADALHTAWACLQAYLLTLQLLKTYQLYVNKNDMNKQLVKHCVSSAVSYRDLFIYITKLLSYQKISGPSLLADRSRSPTLSLSPPETVGATTVPSVVQSRRLQKPKRLKIQESSDIDPKDLLNHQLKNLPGFPVSLCMYCLEFTPEQESYNRVTSYLLRDLELEMRNQIAPSYSLAASRSNKSTASLWTNPELLKIHFKESRLRSTVPSLMAFVPARDSLQDRKNALRLLLDNSQTFNWLIQTSKSLCSQIPVLRLRVAQISANQTSNQLRNVQMENRRAIDCLGFVYTILNWILKQAKSDRSVLTQLLTHINLESDTEDLSTRLQFLFDLFMTQLKTTQHLVLAAHLIRLLTSLTQGLKKSKTVGPFIYSVLCSIYPSLEITPSLGLISSSRLRNETELISLTSNELLNATFEYLFTQLFLSLPIPGREKCISQFLLALHDTTNSVTSGTGSTDHSHNQFRTLSVITFSFYGQTVIKNFSNLNFDLSSFISLAQHDKDLAKTVEAKLCQYIKILISIFSLTVKVNPVASCFTRLSEYFKTFAGKNSNLLFSTKTSVEVFFRHISIFGSRADSTGRAFVPVAKLCLKLIEICESYVNAIKANNPEAGLARNRNIYVIIRSVEDFKSYIQDLIETYEILFDEDDSDVESESEAQSRITESNLQLSNPTDEDWSTVDPITNQEILVDGFMSVESSKSKKNSQEFNYLAPIPDEDPDQYAARFRMEIDDENDKDDPMEDSEPIIIHFKS